MENVLWVEIVKMEEIIHRRCTVYGTLHGGQDGGSGAQPMNVHNRGEHLGVVPLLAPVRTQSSLASNSFRRFSNSPKSVVNRSKWSDSCTSVPRSAPTCSNGRTRPFC